MKSETVALNKKHQGKFARKVSKLKKKVEKGEVKITPKTAPVNSKGLIYIKHLPHGFYEPELRKFFGQFGKVTKARVCRSEKNGKSKGYGFIEFRDDDVSKIAAETMNNYLMFRKRIETKHIPVDKRPKRLFSGKGWKPNQVPRILRVKTINQERNLNLTNALHLKRSKKQLDKLNQKLKKLAALGIQHNVNPVNDPTMPLLETPEDTMRAASLKETVKTLKKKVVGEKMKAGDKKKLLSEDDDEEEEEVEEKKVAKKKVIRKKDLVGAVVQKMKKLGEKKVGLKKTKIANFKKTEESPAAKTEKIVQMKSKKATLKKKVEAVEKKKVVDVEKQVEKKKKVEKKIGLKNGFSEEIVENKVPKKSFEKQVTDKKSLKTILKKKDKISTKKEGTILKSEKAKLAAKNILDNSDLVVKKTKKILKKSK